MHTILVTGGAGFIGSHVTRRFALKNRVIVYDNSLSNLRRPGNLGNVHLIPGDVRDMNILSRIFRKYKPDVVCHIAGQASNINSFSDPHGDVDVNYKGTMNVVSCCVMFRIPRLVYASSMMAGNPNSYYGISKLAAEQFVHATSNRPDLEAPLHVTSLRMFNVYGPGQSITNPYQGVLAIFIGNVLRNEPITIFGTGRQSRDFIYIDDVVDVWEKTIAEKKSFGKVLEVGSGKATSINALAKAVIAASGKKNYPIVHKPARSGDMQVSRAITKTGTIRLSTGLQRTIAWAKRNSAVLK